MNRRGTKPVPNSLASAKSFAQKFHRRFQWLGRDATLRHQGKCSADSAARCPRQNPTLADLCYSKTLRIPRAFTLLEVIIGVSLMSLILVSAYMCFDAGIRGRRIIEPRVEVFQNARVAMALMTEDLRSACSLSRDFEFLGMHRTFGEMPADNLDFATHNYTPRHPREGDFCEESFFLDKDPDSGRLSLFRRRNPTMAPDPLEGGSREEIATGLLGARFEYFDGLDWYDTWGDINETKKETSNRDQPNLTGMPEAVRITLLFDSDPQTKIAPNEVSTNPPLVFQTVARLMLADLQQPGGSDSSSNNIDSSGQNMATGGANP